MSFHSDISDDDVKHINRRGFVPEDLWTSPNEWEGDNLAALKAAKLFGEDDSARIKQVAILNKVQHALHTLSSTRRTPRRLFPSLTLGHS